MVKKLKMEPKEPRGSNTKTPLVPKPKKTKKDPKKPKKEDKKERDNQLIKHFFTYNNYAENAIELLKSRLEPICKQFVFQEEIGEQGTPHLQGCIWLKKKARWSELGLPKTIHWEKVWNWNSSVAYCSKDESRNGRLIKFGFPKELKLIENLYKWQEEILDIIKGPINDRKVYWIYDIEGCNGKTVFSKYLYAKHNAIIATAGGNKDIACLLAILKNDGRDLNEETTFIFNFPRSTEGISYKAIESVKDGLMTSVKYETSTLVFNCPHVICFSNELPEFSKLSQDRWEVFEINKGVLKKWQDDNES